MKKYFRKALGNDREHESPETDILVALGKTFVNPSYGLELLKKTGKLETEHYVFEHREVEEEKQEEKKKKGK